MNDRVSCSSSIASCFGSWCSLFIPQIDQSPKMKKTACVGGSESQNHVCCQQANKPTVLGGVGLLGCLAD